MPAVVASSTCALVPASDMASPAGGGVLTETQEAPPLLDAHSRLAGSWLPTAVPSHASSSVPAGPMASCASDGAPSAGMAWSGVHGARPVKDHPPPPTEP